MFQARHYLCTLKPQAGWQLRHPLYSAGLIPQLKAQYPHGPLTQDAATQVQLLQGPVAAKHRAEVSPPLHECPSLPASVTSSSSLDCKVSDVCSCPDPLSFRMI